MVAQTHGKTLATFMPRNLYTMIMVRGMHVHQSIWSKNNSLFAGKRLFRFIETCLHYIGGIIKHAKAINVFSNATTNSYKRLVPGFEAPVLLAYSAETDQPL